MQANVYSTYQYLPSTVVTPYLVDVANKVVSTKKVIELFDNPRAPAAMMRVIVENTIEIFLPYLN